VINTSERLCLLSCQGTVIGHALFRGVAISDFAQVCQDLTGRFWAATKRAIMDTMSVRRKWVNKTDDYLDIPFIPLDQGILQMTLACFFDSTANEPFADNGRACLSVKQITLRKTPFYRGHPSHLLDDLHNAGTDWHRRKRSLPKSS
jgi:hypothetical protein